MKYALLKQLEPFLSKFKKITRIKRAGDMVIAICFDAKTTLFFDLSKANSAIYSNEEFIAVKEYKAPFDIALKKRFNNSKISRVQVLKDNRILKFSCVLDGSYKSMTNHLYLEFTGRFTNAIITDENGVIVEALRHIENSFRQIKPARVLIPLEPILIKEKETAQISDFEQFFKDEFTRLNEKNLLSLKEIKINQILKKLHSIQENLSCLESEDELSRQSEILSSNATVLLANLHNLKEFEKEVSLRGFNGEILNLKLEDSPKNSANLFFAKAKRLKQKAVGITNERANLTEKREFYLNLLNLIKNAKSASEAEILYPKKATALRQKEPVNESVEVFYINEYKILVGRNEKGNLNLLKNAKKDDIWLHLKDISSSHVIIKTQKAMPEIDVLKFAAKLCVEFSVKSVGRYEVDYTKRANVKINEGANVNYTDYKTIIIQKEQGG